MKSAAVTVTTSPTLIIEKDDVARYVYLHVIGNSTVYLGSSDVSTTNGLHVEKHTSPIEIFVPRNETIFGIVQTSTENIRVLTPDLD